MVPDRMCKRELSRCRSPTPATHPQMLTEAKLALKEARVAKKASGPPALLSKASLYGSYQTYEGDVCRVVCRVVCRAVCRVAKQGGKC